jgi:hypothetical protein
MGACRRDINGMGNFRSEFASTFTLKGMLCNYSNPTDTDTNSVIARANMVSPLSGEYVLSDLFN